jgi:hypothetical protein
VIRFAKWRMAHRCCSALLLTSDKKRSRNLDLPVGNPAMCNLYSLTKTRAELVGLFDIRRDTTQGAFDLSAIYSDLMAPVVRRKREAEDLCGEA